MLKPGALRLPLLLSVLLPALAGAGELYRYVNDKGVIVLDRQGVPPEYIGKGYDVLSDQGRVVRLAPAGRKGPGHLGCPVVAPVFQPG